MCKKGLVQMTIRKGVIDSDGLDVMQRAMDDACKQLKITSNDQSDRKRIAFLVAGFVRAGIHDVSELTDCVVTQFKISP